MTGKSKKENRAQGKAREELGLFLHTNYFMGARADKAAIWTFLVCVCVCVYVPLRGINCTNIPFSLVM